MTHPPRIGRRLAIAAAFSISAVTGVAVASSAGAAGPGSVVASNGEATDQIVVTLDRPGKRLGAADLAAAANGARSARSFGQRAEIVKLPAAQSGATLDATMARLAKRPGVVRVEADQRMHLVTNDTEYAQQWDLTTPSSGAVGIDVEGAWAITTGSASVRVAVIDTGIVDHVDLQGRIVGGYDFIADATLANDGDGRDADPSDPGDWITSQESRRGYFRGCTPSDSSWHGTHVAGTIAAATGNNEGIAGITQVGQVVPIRVLGKCGGYTSDIVDGMRWSAGLPVNGVPANQHPAQVLSLSLGGGGACSTLYQDAVDDVVAAGASVVVAAGNSDSDAGAYSPASCNGVVTVAATGQAGDRSYYSNFGSTVEIAAPGGDRLADDGDTILSTLNSGTRSPVAGGDVYVKYQGTSMATPHVSGVAALMLSANPNLSPAQVTQLLQQSATAFPGGSSCIGICGAGILNAAAAVAAADGSPTTTTTTVAGPTTTTTTTTTVVSGLPGALSKLSPADGATGLKGRITFQWTASSGATGYEVCLDSAVNGSCDGAWQAVSGTSASANGLSKRTTYEWQVRAVNGAGTTDADGGAFFTFTTN